MNKDATKPKTKTSTREMRFVLLPRFNMATLTTMIEPLRIANYVSGESLYRWEFLTPDSGSVNSSCGGKPKSSVVQASNRMEVACYGLDHPVSPEATLDCVALLGSWGAERFFDNRLSNWLRGHERHGVALIGVEIGSYIFARAGLLTRRQATTHWSFFVGFAESFPQVDAREQMFTIDNQIMTCAGGLAGLDLMLHRIAATHDEELAAEIASQMLHHLRAEPHFAQRPPTGHASPTLHPVVRRVSKILEERIENSISIPELCRQIKMPQRKLERLFNKHVGCTIVQFYRFVRLQYARTLLVSTSMDIREISVASGFNSMSYFSHCFAKSFGRKPSQYRLAWPEAETAPSWPGTMYALTHAAKAHQAEKSVHTSK